MQKKEGTTTGLPMSKDWIRLLIGSAAGVVVLCLSCLLFALLMLNHVLSLRLLSLCAALSALLGGFSAAMVIDGREKIIFYVVLTFLSMIVLIFLLGHLLFGGSFDFLSMPLVWAALLIGLILGSIASNLR